MCLSRPRLTVAAIAGVLLAIGSLAAAQARIASYRELPYGGCRFVQDQFGATPDAWQEDLLVAFADPQVPRISLQACAGPGKTAGLAWCAWYFLATQCTRGEHPKGLATGVTAQNLRDNFWAELSKWQSRSPYLSAGFTWATNRLSANDHPETWYLAPRAWPRTGSAEQQGATLSGLHSQNVALFIDESGGIPPTVLRAAEQALGNTTFGKILQAGNPISKTGMLYEAANRLREQWRIIAITGDPDDPKRSPRVSLEWAQQQIKTYGRDNPWVKSYILGQFPDEALNTLLTYEEVRAAMTRELPRNAWDWSQKRLGVDVARFGDDRSVLFLRQGRNGRLIKPGIMHGADTAQIAARCARAIATHGIEATFVDDTGHWGHGVIDQLRTASLPALPVVFHDKAINPRYRNRRAEMWLEMAEWVKSGGALPDIDALVSELTEPTYTFLDGKFALEEKDMIKKRLGRSPDIADALALTFALPDMPNEVMARLQGATGGVGKTVTEYDPMESAS